MVTAKIVLLGLAILAGCGRTTEFAKPKVDTAPAAAAGQRDSTAASPQSVSTDSFPPEPKAYRSIHKLELQMHGSDSLRSDSTRLHLP